MVSNDKETTGIVLLNLGGPDSIEAVRSFLYNLFSDRGIIRLGPSYLQKPIAWFISRLRSKKTEEMYGMIGGKSPILDITTAQAGALEKALNFELASESRHPLFTHEGIKVYIGMRYWHPFIKDTVQRILNDGIKHLVVLSLYPHYSKATTGSAVTEFKRRIQGTDINVQYIEHWYDFSPYIEALSELIDRGISEFKGEDFHLLYSAHSLPESFIEEGDPYLDHIKITIEKINNRLSDAPYNITGLKWHLSFQSKAGPVKWLQPSTEETIIKLAQNSCKNLFIAPISFVSDHIETLYEIDILYKTIAEKYGISLLRCQSLNTSEKFINALKELVFSKLNTK